eukprot:Skav221139  [mRNA]  locus=scaffold3794:44947:47715:- [translate_table: standard]
MKKKVQLSDLPMLPSSDALASMAVQETLRTVAREEVMTLIYAAIAMLFYAISMSLMPVAMMMVIKCAEEEVTDDFNWLDPAWSQQEAMIWWIVIYVVLQAISAVANHWQFHMAYHAGQRMRAQVIMMVFQMLGARPPRREGKVKGREGFLRLQVVLASIILLALVDVSALFGIAVPWTNKTATP